MINRINRLLNLKPGEWQLVALLLLILAINMMVIELTVVTATAGFVSNAGAAQLPWLWLVDMAALLTLSVVYATVVDRIKKVQLMGWVLGVFAFSYLIIQLLFNYGSPGVFNYLLLYIVADQQFFILPLAFWALANDVYPVSTSKRLFPVIGAGFVLGSIIGNILAASSAAIFARIGGQTHQLLGLAAILLLVALAILHLTFRHQELRGRQDKAEKVSFLEPVKVGLDFYHNVPLFHYLAIVIFSIFLAYTLLQYNFLAALQHASADALQFQSFYGWYKVGIIIVTLLLQWLVTGRAIEKIGLKSAFAVFPVMMMIAGVSALAVPGLLGGAVAIFLISVTERAWDEPARKSLQGLIPDERRGRVSTFLDSYLLAVSTIVGCIFLLVLFGVARIMQWPGWVETVVYLAVAILAGGVAIWAAVRARTEYDQSMLNWRLSRRQRRGFTGVMRKLDL